MSVWSTISKIGKVRLGKVREAFRLLAELHESLTDDQKIAIMTMATPDQMEKGMKLYAIWTEFWVNEAEEKK